MKRTIGILIAISFVLVALFVFSARMQKSEQSGEGSEIVLLNQSGYEVSFENILSENPDLTLNFWASWCSFCVKEIPEFLEIAKENPEEIIVFMNRGEKRARGREFFESLSGGDFFLDNVFVLYDEKEKLYREFGSFGMPVTTFFEDGQLSETFRGPLTKQQLLEKLAGGSGGGE